MTTPASVLAEAIADPAWFPHQLDLPGRRVLMVRLPERDVRAAEFLDERVLGRQRDGFWVPAAQWLEEASKLPPRAPQAIFHIGHCGSTLLANLFEALPGVLALREPLILRTLADACEALPSPVARMDRARFAEWFDASVRVLARPHTPGQRVVAKATSSCNALIEPWLERVDEARALMLYIDLDSYLATILKSPASRSDCARFAPARLAFLHGAVGDDTVRLHALDDAQQVALGWVAELLRFERARERFGARCAMLDFAELLDGGIGVLARVAAHLKLDANLGDYAAAWSPAVLGRYAKARNHVYGADDRAADLAESRRRHGDEIDAGLAFADALIARYPALDRVARHRAAASARTA